ncbi:MAG: ATP-dependent nuclease [Caldisphaera sp.]
MISRILIENFRSIKHLDFQPKAMCALIGKNNVGKSNIMEAIKLILTEKWPTYAIQDNDLYNHDMKLSGKINIYFDKPLIYNYYSKEIAVGGFKLEFGNGIREFTCIDKNGEEIISQYGKSIRVTNELRSKASALFIGLDRNLSKIANISELSYLSKILEVITKNFKSDTDKITAFNNGINQLIGILKTEDYNNAEFNITQNVRSQTGIEKILVELGAQDVLDFYKSLRIKVKEGEEYGWFDALEMGAGVQSAIAVALMDTYSMLTGEKPILLIEEPEIYLHPHARKYFYELIKDRVTKGIQIFYTTHSPEFVDITNPESINIVRKNVTNGTYIKSYTPLEEDEEDKNKIKRLTLFDTQKNEMFFSEKIMLVEGQTEEHTIPYLLKLKGVNANMLNIGIINVGGKQNMVFFIKTAKSFGIPFVAIIDSDSEEDNELNSRIVNTGGEGNVFVLDQDFENVMGIPYSKKKINEALKKVESITSFDSLPDSIKNAINHLLSL